MSKVIVITGAGSGLGRELARRLANDGDRVVLLARTRSRIEAVAQQIGNGAMAVGCDICSPDSVRAAFAQIAAIHPRIDVLINNAAIYEPCPVVEASDTHITSIINTNVLGPIFCSRAAIPMMGRGGHIINVSSESLTVPLPYLILYQTSKAGLEEFSTKLGRELEPDGIRVTTVRAGMMKGEDSSSTFDPDMARRFGAAALQAGLNLRTIAISDFRSATEPFRSLIDLPADLQVGLVTLQARHP